MYGIKRKKISVSILLLLVVLLVSGCKTEEMKFTEEMREKNKEFYELYIQTGMIKERSAYFTSPDENMKEGDLVQCYISYSTYKDLTKEEEEKIAEHECFAHTRMTAVNGDQAYHLNVKCNIIFYKDDTSEVIDKFIYNNDTGKREEADKNTEFIGPDKFDSFEDERAYV